SSRRAGRVSVVFTVPLAGLEQAYQQELTEDDGPWELRCYYRPSTAKSDLVRRVSNLIRYLRSTRKGLQRLASERGKPDLTHVHILVRPALVAWWLGVWQRIPFLLSEQSSEYLDGTWVAKSAVFKAANIFLFRRAKAVTAVSSHLGDALQQLGLCARYEVVPNTVPGIDRPLPPAGPVDRFMMVADLVDRTKNVSGVLQAIRNAKDHGHLLHLQVIGDGPDGDRLKRMATELGIDTQVMWLGRLPNARVLEHMADTGTVIINSNVETFSVVTGEALASGKPVIATRCGGPAAFITPTNGVLIEPRDTAALTGAMIDRATGVTSYDPALVRASVSDRFSPDAVGAAFLTIYQR
ncbi:MAG: glycosyltransferase, partial [Flavobacteriales bacterium]|nr:glycosyltransferase [Flavobacteriales bacterium]